jgi:dolichyl-phosphate-mannose-protein mannosyltransferase
MWSTNKALSADHPFASRPTSWPLLSRGLGFWNGNHVPKTEEEHKRQKEIEARKGVDPHYKPPPKTDSERAEEKRLRAYYKKFQSSQIYLLGNPVVWFLSTASLLVFVGLTLVRRMAERRGKTPTSLSIYHGQGAAGFFFISWLLHWVPFFAMQRQLFLHHYLPALYFAVLLLAVQVNHLFYVSRVSRGQAVICGIVVAFAVAAFAAYAPLSYGLKMSKEYCQKIKLTSKWDFDCDSLKPATK